MIHEGEQIMKKTMKMIALALVCMMVLAIPALASAQMDFTRRDFYGGQTLPVYRGPGEEYGRGGSGWAKASTDEALYAAGREGDWALVMYGTGNGTTRVGWIDLTQFKYNIKILKLQNLNFEYKRAKITAGCTLTDDPTLASRDLGYMSAGTSVTYLSSFYKHRQWAYIETWMEGRPIRAFVPMDCISF